MLNIFQVLTNTHLYSHHQIKRVITSVTSESLLPPLFDLPFNGNMYNRSVSGCLCSAACQRFICAALRKLFSDCRLRNC